MSGAGDGEVCAEPYAVFQSDGRNVQKSAIVVEKNVVADVNIDAVLTVKRGENPHGFAL